MASVVRTVIGFRSADEHSNGGNVSRRSGGLYADSEDEYDESLQLNSKGALGGGGDVEPLLNNSENEVKPTEAAPTGPEKDPNSIRKKRSSIVNRSIREHAALRIQRWYRGSKVRIMFAKVFERSMRISPRAVDKILRLMIRTHRGWARFLLHVTLLSLFVAMVIVQMFHISPSSPEVNLNLIAFVKSVGFDPTTKVTRSQQVFDYVEAILPELGRATNPGTMPLTPNNVSETCADVFNTYCELNNVTNYEQFLRQFAQCAFNQTTYNNGYMDNQNRLQFGILITQTRYRTAPCITFRDARNIESRLPRHECLDSYSPPAAQYESEICGTPDAPNPTANCYRFSEFRYNNLTNTFPLLFNGINLGNDYEMQRCRIGVLRELGWLDYRSRQVCMLFFTFNSNQNGRLAAFRDCFTFAPGGKVSFERDVASAVVVEGESSVLGITWAFGVMLLVWTFWELNDMVRHYRKAKRCIPRFGDVTTLIILALCVMDLVFFGVLHERTMAFAFEELDPPSYGGFEGTFWNSVLGFLKSVQDWQQYYILLAFTMFFFIFRTLIVLDFHPNVGIVSGTLRHASQELASFLLVYMIILICYSCLGMVFFASNFTHFSTLGYAMMTMIVVSFMQFDSVGFIVLDPAVAIGSFETSNWIIVLWYYSFIILVSLLLLNVLLSIVVGAFVEFQERRKEKIESFGLIDTLIISIGIWIRYCAGLVVRLWKCCPRGNSCCRKKKRDDSTPKATNGDDKGDDEETGDDGVSKGNDLQLDAFDTVASLNRIRWYYRRQAVSGIEMRNRLTPLFRDPTVPEKLLAKMRLASVRERYTAEVLSFEQKHFKEKQYKGHMLSLVETLVTQSNASAVAASVKKDPDDATSSSATRATVHPVSQT